ncbi:MAG: LPS export ABC transporter periplasmic protein LptC [Bacillota bacterium]
MDRKSIFLALFIFIIIALAFYFTMSEAPIVPEDPAAEEEETAEEELEGVEFTIYNDRQNQELKLKSDKVDNFKDEQRMELRPVEVEVYSTASNKLLYTLDGDLGIYYTARDYLELRGNVVIDSEEYHILTDELDYEMQQNYLEGRGSVKISGSDFESTADTFSSDLDLKDLKLSQKDSTERARIIFKQLTEGFKKEESNYE